MKNSKLEELKKIYSELQEDNWHSSDVELAQKFLILSREFYQTHANRIIDSHILKVYLDSNVSVEKKKRSEISGMGKIPSLEGSVYTLILIGIPEDYQLRNNGFNQTPQEYFKKILDFFNRTDSA